MPNLIDWTFIASPAIEGRNLIGCVPDAEGSNSGVTVGMGLDLGQMNTLDMMHLGLPQELLVKIIPYAALRGTVAQKALTARPLVLTADECILLEAKKKAMVTQQLTTAYLRDAAYPFEQLAQGPQTALASLQWMLGSVAIKAPHTWKDACKRNWEAVIADLEDFHDRYPSRHKHEADYLRAHLT